MFDNKFLDEWNKLDYKQACLWKLQSYNRKITDLIYEHYKNRCIVPKYVVVSNLVSQHMIQLYNEVYGLKNDHVFKVITTLGEHELISLDRDDEFMIVG